MIQSLVAFRRNCSGQVMTRENSSPIQSGRINSEWKDQQSTDAYGISDAHEQIETCATTARNSLSRSVLRSLLPRHYSDENQIGMINSSALFDSTKTIPMPCLTHFSAYEGTRRARAPSFNFFRLSPQLVAPQKSWPPTVPFK